MDVHSDCGVLAGLMCLGYWLFHAIHFKWKIQEKPITTPHIRLFECIMSDVTVRVETDTHKRTIYKLQ